MERKSDTVKPLDKNQSWKLLIQLLGPNWQLLDREDKISQSEITAARSMLDRLEGLPLAIQEAAHLVKNANVGGPSISKTFEVFEERIRTLPERSSKPRSTAETALDSLWDMSFSLLSKNAKVLLGVLAWLSPGMI
jgi:predicted ATPase